MSKMAKIKIAAFSILFLFTLHLHAQSISQILVVSEVWEDCTNEDGSGLYYDILRAVYEPEGIGVTTKAVPYVRSTVMVQTGKADVVVGSYIDEIGNVTYPEKYFDADDVSAMFLKRNESSWTGESGLRDKKCSYIRGYEMNEYIDVPIQVYEVDDREAALKMLSAGRIDYFLDNYAELETALEENPSYNGQVTIESIKNLYLYMGFQNNASGKKLAEIWDTRIEEMKSSGELYQIYDEWDSGDWYNELFN